MSEFVAMPPIFRVYNACTDACDMLVGPCACGAWHHAEEWVLKRIMPEPEHRCSECTRNGPCKGCNQREYCDDGCKACLGQK